MDVLELLKSRGAIQTGGHFVYASTMHGTDYVNKDAIYPYPHLVSSLCLEIAKKFTNDAVEVVVGPELGGVILAQGTAFHLSVLTGQEVLAVTAEKSVGEGFTLNRGYDKLVTKKRVLIVEDVVNTGGTVRRLVKVVRNFGGIVVGVGAICNRGSSNLITIGNVPKFESLAQLNFRTWSEQMCKHKGPCSRGIPINKSLGHGKRFPTGK